MLRNYLTVALRSLRRQAGYAFLNVAGLAVGMACGALILLFVLDEVSYDRRHPGAERTFRVVKDFVNDDGSRLPDATTPPALAPALLRGIPEIEEAVRLFPSWGQQWLVRRGERSFLEANVVRADPAFFRVFSAPFVRGSARTALARPGSIVLTETTARRYFGSADPLGQTLALGGGGEEVTVTGVVRDVPAQSHFTYDLLLTTVGMTDDGSLDTNWGWYNFYTYVRLRPGAVMAAVEPKIREVFHAADPDNENVYYTQPLAGLGGIHLASDLKWELAPNGDARYVYVFLTVALLVIVVACVNYVNLTTARAVKRAKEVGVRKALGAERGRLVRQFLAESGLTTALAGVLAVGLVAAALPFFNSVTGKTLALGDAGGLALGVLAAIALLCGLLAGAYPALHLSGFNPITALKGVRTPPRGLGLRRGLVVFQFVVSAVLLVGVLVIREQMAFVRGARLGFDPDRVVVVRNTGGLPHRGETFEAAVRQIPGVESVAHADGMLGGQNWTNDLRARDQEEGSLVNFLSVGYDFLDVMDLDLVEGRAFSPAFPSDSLDGIILSETAVRELGVPTPAVGQQIVWAETDDGPAYVTVVGVVRDFNFASLRTAVAPFAFVYTPSRAAMEAVELAPTADVAATMAAVERAWDAAADGVPFDAYFVDESVDDLYHADLAFGRVFSAMTGLGLLVACLGLFGLAAFTAEQRTKEIGVRKVLGAGVGTLVGLLARDFLWLVALAFVLGLPLAYLAMHRWLEGFAYHVELGPGVFVLAGVLTMLVALLAVAYQALRAATTDPVKALRYE